MSSGTVPFNFPPEASLDIGSLITGTSLQNTAALPPTAFFTAPTTGIYWLNVAVHIVSTNGAGTINLTLQTPGAAPITAGQPVTLDFRTGNFVWLNQGQSASITTTLAGVTGTTYNVYLVARRVF